MVHSTTTLAPSTSSCDAGYTTVGSKCYKVVTSSANYLQVGFSNNYDIDTMIDIQRMLLLSPSPCCKSLQCAFNKEKALKV